MAYRLKGSEGFSHGAKRIVLDQIDKALAKLKPTVRDKDEAIHDVRVSVKKIRALLRLIRDSLGKTYKVEDKAYREVGRNLSKVRDSAAMLETIDRLTEHFADQLAGDAFASIRTPLRQAKTRRPQARKQSMREAAKSLREARKRLKDWPDITTQQSLSRGLKRVFKNGRTGFDAAVNHPGVETFHEWRKQVKHLLNQTRILSPLWGNMMSAWATELKTLGKYLSEDHDLALLRDEVSDLLEDAQDTTDIEALIALIDQRRNELQLNAKTLGTRIYAETPKTFVARTKIYWQAWRSEVKNDPIILG